MKSYIYELRISSVDESCKLTPENLSAYALSQYIESLIILLGGKKNKDTFTFKGLTEGSACLAMESNQSYESVENKTPQIDKVNDILASNGHKAELKKDGNIIYAFNGIKEESIIELYQEASFYGQVIKIGGKDETIPLALKDNEGNIVNLTIKDKTLAKEIGQYYLGQEIECKGQGVLIKNKKNKWLPATGKFIVSSFEVMDDISIIDWITQFQSLPSNWKKEENIDEACAEIRGSDN